MGKEKQKPNIPKKNIGGGHSEEHLPAVRGILGKKGHEGSKTSVEGLQSAGILEPGRCLINAPQGSLREETGVAIINGLKHESEGEYCEDFILIREGVRLKTGGYDVYGIFDGVGGKYTAGEDSETAAREIDNFIVENSASYDDPRKLLVDALTRANEKLIENYVKKHGIEREDFGTGPHIPYSEETPGTTATIAIVGQTDITIGHVGDSRLYVFSKGEGRQVTEDELVEYCDNILGVDTEELNLQKRVRTIPYDSGSDTLVLMSDGLYKPLQGIRLVKPENYLGDILFKSRTTPQEACAKIIKEVSAIDDLSIIIRAPKKPDLY